MGLFSSPAEWDAVGAAFGLAKYKPTASFSVGVSFRQLKRSLGLPALHHPPSFDHWHYGKYRDVEVAILVYTEGSGSSQTTHTGVIARIDPPLFLGISVRRKPIFELFASPYTSSGDAQIDAHLRIDGFDAPRTIGFLELHTPEGRDLINRIIANKDDLHISDSVVVFTSSGYQRDIEKTRWQLEMVTYIATTLARARTKLPLSPGEQAQRASWQQFADSVGFKLDPLRMTVFGQHNGAHLKIALETEHREIRTAVNVRFPRPVHVAFTARRTEMFTFLQGLFGQDIKIGDKAFDDLFLVTGHPEPVIRELLGHPDLIRALTYLAATTTEVQLNHEQLFFRVKGALGGDALLSVCETARVTCEAFFGRVEGIGPYRS